jgi:hypothetical protein
LRRAGCSIARPVVGFTLAKKCCNMLYNIINQSRLEDHRCTVLKQEKEEERVAAVGLKTHTRPVANAHQGKRGGNGECHSVTNLPNTG